MPTELDGHQLTWYMQEICMHGLGARLDYQALVDALDQPETRQTRLVWFHLTSFLSHSAMISKYASPISKNDVAVERKKALCHLLNIDPDSEVLPRDARDNVEHFDERIDNWVRGNSSTILEIVLPNRDDYIFIKVNDKRVKRVLILDELKFISEKKDESKFELALRPLYHEVKRISTEAEKWISGKSPYHFIYPK